MHKWNGNAVTMSQLEDSKSSLHVDLKIKVIKKVLNSFTSCNDLFHDAVNNDTRNVASVSIRMLSVGSAVVGCRFSHLFMYGIEK